MKNKLARLLTVAVLATILLTACDPCPDDGDKKTETVSPAPVKKEPVAAVDTSAPVKYEYEKVKFQTNEHRIMTVWLPSLNRLADTLRANPSYVLTINGYTDSTGPDDFNLLLSEQRSDEIKDYLHTKGICDYRIETFGFGKAKPVADNGTAQGRQDNRRVEIFLITKSAS